MLSQQVNRMRATVCLTLLIVLAQVAVAQTVAPLASSTAPASIALRMQPGLYQADIEVNEATAVTLFCPIKPGLISFTGLTGKSDVSYDQKARTLTVSLRPGKYSITIRPL